MHSFVHSKALDVRKRYPGMTRFRHLFRIIEALERDVLGVRSRVRQLNQCAQWKTDPRYDYRPGFHTAMTVDTLFERSDLEQRVEIEHPRLGDRAFNGDGPRDRPEVLRIASRVALARPELVKILVLGYFLNRGRLRSRAQGTFLITEF